MCFVTILCVFIHVSLEHHMFFHKSHLDENIGESQQIQI